MIEDAFRWLKIKYVKPIVYKSDRLGIYYEYALKLIKKGKAYVCHCSQSGFKSLKDSKTVCPCRSAGNQEMLWKKMFKASPGSAVLRLKTDMAHPNPAFRDRVLFKISDRNHPRVGNKYRVWPTLELSWAVDDHLLGITHIIRGEDLRIETDMEKYIWDIFSWKYPETIHTGLVNLEGVGAKISKSKAQKEVKSGVFSGWDDPRTWSIQSLRRRGIKSEAIREFVESIGLNKQNISAPIESLYSMNRKMIDLSSDRYSFVRDGVELKVFGAPKVKSVKVPVHPEKKTKREIKVGKIFISRNDLKKFKGKEIRLLHLYNIKLDGKEKAVFVSEENKNIPKVNWVSDGLDCEVLMSDGSLVSGLVESGVKKLKMSEVVQFERFGFVSFDGKKGKKFVFWFGHK